MVSILDDIENQGAAELAREVDPSGARTIGMYIISRHLRHTKTSLA